MTNLIESVNAQLRHYGPNITRKGKSYAKSALSLKDNPHILFYKKLIISN